MNNLINNLTMTFTALTAAFTGWQSYETRKSNLISNRHNWVAEQRNQVKESMVAIQKFDDKIISKLEKGTPSVKDAMKMLTYINRWSYYINGDITDVNIVKEAVSPYLKIISDTFGKAVLNLSKSNQDLLSNYINLMLEFGLNPM